MLMFCASCAILAGMANKTYNQYCAIAHALDIVGERWSLLIVRNLLAGPKRFSDLMKGLPGISTNILTNRLKTLEEHAVIVNRYLPPPAASTVYELTESGYGLVGALGALAQWGAHSLGTPRKGQKIPPESIIFMIQGVFWRDVFPDEHLAVSIHVKDAHYDRRFSVRLSSDGVVVAEDSLQNPDVGAVIALEPLLQLSSGLATLQALMATEAVQLTGEQHHLDALLQWVGR